MNGLLAEESVLAPGWSACRRDAADAVLLRGPHLVVAPHPDDETIMYGGLIQRLADARQRCVVVSVTDGGAAYPTVIDRRSLERRRRQELVEAVATLSGGRAEIVRLGLSDGKVAQRHRELAVVVAELIEHYRPVVVATPWRLDTHPDHEAVAVAAATAVTESSHRPLRHYEAPFWGAVRFPPPHDVVMSRLQLDPLERNVKRRALECHSSQTVGPGVVPILDSSLMDLACDGDEFFLERRVE